MKKSIFITLIFIISTLHLHGAEQSFNFTFGSNLGNIPLEIKNIKKNSNTLNLVGIKNNKWILLPSFSSFAKTKDSQDFTRHKISKEIIYLKINFKF